MKIKLFALGCLLASNFAHAGQAVVYWEDVTKFSDVDSGVSSQPKFNKRLKKKVSEHFGKLAEKMPAGYKWEIQIHDIDLAGKVSRAYRGDREPLRVFDTFFNPSMEISYRVSDANGKVVANDKRFKLTDRYVERYPSKRTMQRFLSYEKYMVNAWFNKVLLPFVEQG